jgi:phage host-nuclease inhibitor protein Gam
MEEKKEPIQNWKQADQALERIGVLETRINRMRSKAAERITAIEQRLGEESARLSAEMAGIRSQLEVFFRGNSQGMRSRNLPSGRMGFRQVSSLEIPRPQTTLHRLVERGLGDCVRLRQEIDRQALRHLDDEVLRSLGVSKNSREVFYTCAGAR